MKILSIDTSSNVCGVSILENTNSLITLDNNTGRTHSEDLMPMIKKSFDDTSLYLKDMNFIVCNIGPGSFTGIRIGIATAKAFHDSLGISCVGITSLESLACNVLQEERQKNIAFNTNSPHLVCSILDCKNNNCYFALYELKENSINTLIEPACDSIEACISILEYYLGDNFEKYDITFVGDGSKSFQDKIKYTFSNCKIAEEHLDTLNSYNLGICGLNKYYDGLHLEDDILPFYLKKPQAQTQLENKNVKIDLMTLDDLEYIKDSLVTDFDDFWNYDVFKEELKNNNSKYLIAKIDNEIVGFAGIKVILDQADIMNIVTKKSFRKQGIGFLLLKNLAELCRNLDLKSVSLEVNEANITAINLYKKLDFKEIGLRKNYYKDNNAIIMKKELY